MSKISAYTALSSAASNDVVPVVDVDDTTMASSGTTKKITVANLLAALSGTSISGLTGLTITAPTGNAIVASTDGTSTSAGAFVVNPSAAWAGVYDTVNSLYYGISRTLPSPSGASTLGGYYDGLGVGGQGTSSLRPVFGVLALGQSGNGLGSTAFTVLGNNKVVTFYNTLDDSSGNATVAGLQTLNGGTNTSGSAPVITGIGATSGSATQLSDHTRDYLVYFTITTSGTATSLTIGHTSGASDVTIVPSGAATAGTLWTFRLPAGWYLKWTGTTTAISNQVAVGC